MAMNKTQVIKIVNRLRDEEIGRINDSLSKRITKAKVDAAQKNMAKWEETEKVLNTNKRIYDEIAAKVNAAPEVVRGCIRVYGWNERTSREDIANVVLGSEQYTIESSIRNQAAAEISEIGRKYDKAILEIELAGNKLEILDVLKELGYEL